MRKAPLPSHLRGVQDDLNRIKDDLEAIKSIALHRDVTPARIAHIQAAINDNTHAWEELNRLTTSLELTGQGQQLQEDPAMTTVRTHMRNAENSLEFVRVELEAALQQAQTASQDPRWTQAITKALTDNQEHAAHIHNIGTCFGLATEPPI